MNAQPNYSRICSRFTDVIAYTSNLVLKYALPLALTSVLFFSVNSARALDAPAVLVPPDLTVGDTFYVVFVTQSTYTPNVNMSSNDSRVQSEANSAGFGSSVGLTWKVLGATSSTTQSLSLFAADSSRPIYTRNGDRVADNRADLFDGTLAVPIDRTPSNGVLSCVSGSFGPKVLTGLNSDGTLATPITFTGFFSFTTYGNCASTTSTWVNNNTGSTDEDHFYGVSPLLTVPADRDANLLPAGAIIEPVAISTVADTPGEAVGVFDFLITDGGTSDGVATTISQIVLSVGGTTTDATRAKITFRLNGPDASNVVGVYNASSDTLTFSGLSISVANASVELYTISAYYNDNSGINDGQTVFLIVDGDTNVTVGPLSTRFGTTTPVSNGIGSSTSVVATRLEFTTQPNGSVSGSALSTQPVVAARDAFGNTDRDFTETITLSEASAGSLTNNAQNAVNGVATLFNLTYSATADQESFTLTANDQDGVGSDLPTVNSNAVTSDVVATKLLFTVQPLPVTFLSGLNQSFTTVPVVSAVNASDLTDTGYSSSIVLTTPALALLSGTGDIDASTTTVTLNPSSGAATFTALAMNYTSTFPGSFSFPLRATSGALTVGLSNSLTVFPRNSDANLTSASTVTEPVALSTVVDTVGEAVGIFDFTITDGATSDSLSTTITQIVLNVSGSTSDATRGKISFRLNGPDASNVAGVYNAGADTLTFSGLSISISNGSNETYTVNAHYNDNSGIIDGQTVVLSVDGDTDLTVEPAGTQFGTTTPVTNGTGSTTAVEATALIISTQPAGSVSGAALTTQPVIVARDAFGNTDTDFVETITMSEGSAGTLSNSTQAAFSGVATFANLLYTASVDQESFTLTANDQDGVGTDLPTVNANALTSDVVATKLLFNTQPAPLSVLGGQSQSFSPVPVIHAADANNTTDTDYVSSISLAEVNGAGSAEIVGTGDTDGSPATVTLTPSSGVATFTGLSLTYTNSGVGGETFNLRAASGVLAFADSSQLSSTERDTDADLTAATGVIEPVALSTVIDTVGEAVSIFDFALSDGGTADGLATTVSRIVLNVSGTTSDATRAKINFQLNGPDASNVVGVYDDLTDTVTFSGLSISIADGTDETYAVNAFYNDNSAIIDGQTVVLSVDGDTDLTVGSSGTQFDTTNPVTNGSGTTTAVEATALIFSTQPAGSVSGAALTTQPVVVARDAFGNTDTDFAELITLSEASAGSLSNATQVAVSGIATFTNLLYTASADQESFTLSANDEDAVGSDLPAVDANAVTSDVVATKLLFTSQPAPTSIQSTFLATVSTVPVVAAVDAQDVVDMAYATAIILSEINGSGSAVFSAAGDTDASPETVTILPSAGAATFTGLQVTYTSGVGVFNENINLAAASGTLAGANSVDITVVGDNDNDGLTNSDENSRGTDPNNPDSDGDGVSDGQEVSDGTNPLDPGSSVPVLSTKFCSEWNSYLEMLNVNEYVNSATASRDLDILLQDLDGVAQSMTGTSVLASSQRDVLVHDLEGFVPNSYGRTCTEVTNGDPGDIDGRTIWYHPGGTGFDFAISLPYFGGKIGSQFVPFNTYHPSLFSSNFVANWVMVVNDSTTAASGTVLYYGHDGSLLGTESATLAEGARRDFSAHQFGGNKVGLVEWRPNDQTSRWVVRNVRYYYDNTVGAPSFNSAMQVEGAKATGEAIVVPLDKRNGSAVLELSNATNAAITVAATYRNLSGSVALSTSYELPAYGTIHVVADSILSTELGSVSLDGNAAGSVIAVGVHYSRDAAAELINAYALFSREAKGSALRSSYNTFLGQSCDLILVNSTNSEVTSSITMTRFDGTVVADGVTVTTPANGVTNYNLCANDTADAYGSVVVEPGVPDSISGAVVRHGANESYQFGTELRQFDNLGICSIGINC
jgi:hypothetical protein